MPRNQPLPAHLDPQPARIEGRRHPRRALHLDTKASASDGAEANVTIHNLSAAGLLIETDLALETGEVLALSLPEIGPVGAEIVWQSGRLYGCAFEQALGEAALAAAQLRGAPQIGEEISAPDEKTPMSGFAVGDTLGLKLNRQRRELGLTLEQVASALGVSKPTVWAWEKGKARPLPERLTAIAQVLGVDEADLADSSSAGGEGAIVEDCRQRLATAYRVPISKIRIMIDL